MSDIVQDMWPADIAETGAAAPLTFVRRQAALLAEKTNRALVARVLTDTSVDTFTHSFDILAPALDNYTYRAFRISHGMEFYPVRFYTGGESGDLKSEADFLEWLGKTLSSEPIKRIIRALVAQVKP